jgi:predicted AlkP superfamily pyrophosphatase or phosphodiesterase
MLHGDPLPACPEDGLTRQLVPRWRIAAAAALVAAALTAWGQLAGAESPDFELRAEEQTLKLARTGGKSQGQLRVALARLMPGEEVSIHLEIAPANPESGRFFEVGLDATEVLLGPTVLAREFLSLNASTREGALEGAEEVFLLTAATASGKRELRIRIIVDEQQPLIAIGRDDARRPERTYALARGGRATFRLELSNLGVLAGSFKVTSTTPPGWHAGFPDRTTVTRSVGLWKRKLDLEVEVSDSVAAGERATIVVEARSLDTQEVSRLELEVENGGRLHVASVTGTADTHLVPPGGETTWVARFFPFDDGPRRFDLELTSSTPDWEVDSESAEVVLEPGAGPVEVVVAARAPAGAVVGTRGAFELTASGDTARDEMKVELVAQVTGLPRIYIVAIDALGEEYLELDRAGTGPGSEGDWLMPRIRGLMERGTAYLNASSNLPSVTDVNHLNILCGTLTGTSGVSAVQNHFGGRDVVGRPVRVFGSRDFLRYGPRGEPVATLFDGVRALEPLARGAFVSGKYWVNDLLEDGGETLRISVSGKVGPDYVGRPEVYVLGDPASDPDRESDPPARFTLGTQGVDEFMGSAPDLDPSDAYIMEAALRVIAHEDPEVMYIILGSMDYVQHAMGNASDLGEWDDLGTPSTYDDVNLVNQLATREEVLDVARDADHQLGRLLDFLEERGRLDGSYVVVTADHGQVTHPPRGILVERVLRRAGIAPTEVAIQAGSSQIIIYDLDEEKARLVETALEPLGIVYNRAEMETGFDEATGTAFALPGELYSEYWVGRDNADGIQYRWPSLYVFHAGKGQYVIDRQFWANPHEPLLPLLPPKTWFVGGHGGPATQHVAIILSGPGIESSVVRYEPVRLHQIAPTIYQLLGIAPPAGVDGLPLP